MRRGEGVIPETGQTELASWLACAVCSYPDDAPLISMALGEIESSKKPQRAAMYSLLASAAYVHERRNDESDSCHRPHDDQGSAFAEYWKRRLPIREPPDGRGPSR